jgi:hypothetical protein
MLRTIGALSTLGLFVNGWSVEKTLDTFTKLAAVAFPKRNLPVPSFLHRLFQYTLALILDARYPEKNMNLALQSVFGENSQISDTSFASRFGIKVGIPVATIAGPSLCIFTNYRKMHERCSDNHHIHLRDSSIPFAKPDYFVLHGEQEKLWEM